MGEINVGYAREKKEGEKASEAESKPIPFQGKVSAADPVAHTFTISGKTKEKDRVRYPMTLLQRTPVQYMSIYHQTTYFCRLGVVEVVYPETMGYRDGI